MEKDELHTLYVENQMTMKEIAEFYNVKVERIKYLCKKYKIPTRSSGRRFNNEIIGKVYDKLTVLGRTKNHEKVWYYECRCECGNLTDRSFSELTKKDTKKMCWECRNLHIKEIKWKGCGDISGDKWFSIRSSAEKRNLIFDITIEQAWDLFLSQNKRCALTDIELYFTHKIGDIVERGTASLDRINSKEGYTIQNVQWVHKNVNTAKMDMEQKDFIEICKKVASKFSN